MRQAVLIIVGWLAFFLILVAVVTLAAGCGEDDPLGECQESGGRVILVDGAWECRLP